MENRDPGDEHVYVRNGRTGEVHKTDVQVRKYPPITFETHIVITTSHIMGDVTKDKFLDDVMDAYRKVYEQTAVRPTEIYLTDEEIRDICSNASWFVNRVKYISSYDSRQGFEGNKRFLSRLFQMHVFVRPSVDATIDYNNGGFPDAPFLRAYSGRSW